MPQPLQKTTCYYNFFCNGSSFGLPRRSNLSEFHSLLKMLRWFIRLLPVDACELSHRCVIDIDVVANTAVDVENLVKAVSVCIC